MDLHGKRLLVLGGTALSCEIIKQAQQLGVYVLVTDYLEDSPGKKIADESFMVSTIDVGGVVDLIRHEKIDGVLTGFIEMMLPYYQSICEKSGLPCYGTRAQFDIARNKDKFKQLCRKFNVPVVQDYQIQSPLEIHDLARIKYPVVIKPVDSGGARGVYICKSPQDLVENFTKSLQYSTRKRVVVERHISGNEVVIYYLIQDHKICLISMCDRHTKNQKSGIIPLPVAYIFPSKHLKAYQKNINPMVIEMFQSIGIRNGLIFVQAFFENGNFKLFEMGYRLAASLEYKIIATINQINPLEMMINFALTGSMHEDDIKPLINPNYTEWGFSTTFLAKPGQVGRIAGVDKVLSLENVIDVVPIYGPGDFIPESAVGTLKQVLLRVFGSAKTKEKMAGMIDNIHDSIEVFSADGENMLLDCFDTKELF